MRNSIEGEKKRIDSELWHACAGPLVSLPPAGSLVIYFPQGHSEQVAASMQKEIDSIPNCPSLPSKLICLLLDVTLHADAETDVVYAQLTLQPVSKYDRDAMLSSEIGLKQNKQPAEFFCKTLTASDTSTHGGFSVPRRAAEKIFPPLDFTMQPPAQELVAKDLHDVSWTFRHIYRGKPKRHLLTTGWSVFVSTKKLSAGDSVLFIRDAKSQLLLGIRRANRQQPALSSSVLSSDSMHIGILAAAAHAATNNSPFTIFYNPRASPSEFVIPLATYNKAVYTQVSLGMRFRMLFESEDSGVRRYLGTVTGISDIDPIQWKNSQWRNLQVGWDESIMTERRSRVSVWEIEPVATPFYLCPPFFRPKFPKPAGFPDEYEVENGFQRVMPWLNDDFGLRDIQCTMFPGLSLAQWMAMQQNSQRVTSASQPACLPTLSSMHDGVAMEDSAKMLSFQTHAASAPRLSSKNPQTQQLQLPHQQQKTQLPPQTSVSLKSVLQQKSVHLQQHLQQQGQLQQPQPQRQNIVTNQEPVDDMQCQESSGHIVPQNHSPDQHLQPTHLQQKGVQDSALTNLGSLHPSSLSQVLQVQQPLEYQQFLLQKQQEQFLQMQLLQKIQQQQLLSQLSSQVQSQLPQLLTQRNLQFLEQQDFQTCLDGSKFLLLPEKQLHHAQNNNILDNSPSTDNHITSFSFHGKSQQGPVIWVGETAVPPADNLLQEFQSKPQVLDKHEHLNPKELVQLHNQLPVADQLDASSTTSFCIEVMPDTLLSRSLGTGKDIQNISCYGQRKDIDTELSTADISSRSFGVADMSFNPGCSTDVVNEGILSRGVWTNQPARMRTYTKVQKRGSVGRCIDVTHYKGYEELRHYLGRMFGIEGQLEEPHGTEWKLVYIDHENDILLVGDDPWEEFINCVQSIKILSAAEVQQMSLDGNLTSLSVRNEACSGHNSGNVWSGQLDDAPFPSSHH